MERITNRLAVCGLAALMSVGLSRSTAAQTADTAKAVTVETVELTVFRAKEPSNPPAAKRETRTPAPSADAVWVPGFWDLQGNRATASRAGWVWVPGGWIKPPVAHARWDPGHWGWSDQWYSWIPGHWVVPGRHGYQPNLATDQETELEMSAP
jgi:hypothetical protein